MNYLITLNNELITFITMILFMSLIILTIATLCEFFGKRKLKLDLFVVCRILNIMLLIIWAYIFFTLSKLSKTGEIVVEILAYYSLVVLIFEISLMCVSKKWILAINFPFLIMMLPLWKYVSKIFSIVLIIIAIVYLFMKAIVIIYNSLFKLKNNINYYSLKEALDGSKNGLLFEDKFNVVYENLTMKNLLEKLGISRKLNIKEIWGKLKLQNNANIIDKQTILIVIDKQVYSFSMIKNAKLQIVAFDITQEYLTTIKIQKTQKELQSKQNEIANMIDNIEEIEKQKEVLILKSKLHDILGQRLFILHHILDTIDEQNFDLEHIKHLLTSMLVEIRNDDANGIQNMQKSIVSAFEMVGFKIEFMGELPKDIQKSKAIIKIIRECATNAIRHANASALFVNVSKNRIEITDDGKLAPKFCGEGTGIKGMRMTAKSIGGKLYVDTLKKFKIIIDI